VPSVHEVWRFHHMGWPDIDEDRSHLAQQE
jgi:hypothetical protein